MKNAIERLLPFFGAACTLGVLLPLSVNRRAPYAQITGHYAPLPMAAGPRLVAVGTDSECDLRLTETGVADVHGWIELRSDGGLLYIHNSPVRGTEHIEAGSFPAAHWSSFERLKSGDSIEVTGPRQSVTTTVKLVDGLSVELWSNDGVRRKTLLPRRDGSGVPLAEGDGTVGSWLLQCDGGLAFASSQDCSGATRLGFASAFFALASPFRPPAKAPLPSWLRGGRIRKARTVENAFAVFDDRDVIAIPEVNAIDLAEGARRGFVLYRTGRKNPLPRVARIGDPGRTVWLHSKNNDRKVGETDLANGDTLSIGDSYFRVNAVSAGAQSRVELHAQEKYDRFHLFYSLSAGRLNFTNSVRDIPNGAGASPLLVQGRTGERAVFTLPSDEGLPAQTEVSWKLPLPRWAAADGGITPGDAALLPLSRFRAAGTDDAMQLTAVSLQKFAWSSLTPDAGAVNTARQDGIARFAGHILTFHRQPPQYEQIGLPLMMVLALGILGWIAVGGILHATEWPKADSSTTTFRPLLRAFAITAVICIWVLLVVGVLLMARMASVDSLVGKTDYYHRQLFYSYLTAALVTSILAGVASRGEPKPLENARWMGWPLSLRVLIASGALLLVWQLLDALLFRMLVGVPKPIPSIVAQLIAGGALLLGFVLGGVVTVLSDDSRASRIGLVIVTLLLAAGVVTAIGHKRWILAGLAFVIGLVWVVLHAIRSAPEPPRMGETQQVSARLGSDALTRARAWLLSAWWKTRSWQRHTRRDVLDQWSKVQSGSTILVLLGLFILAVGSGFYRGRGGMGVKPAEFTVWFLAPGFCMLLATNFSRRAADPVRPSTWRSRWRKRLNGRGRLYFAAAAGGLSLLLLAVWGRLISPLFVAAAVLPPIALLLVGQWGRTAPAEGDSPVLDFRRSFRIYEPVLLTVIMIELLVIVLYVLQGDFGPLLVLVPTVIFVTVLWAGSPEPNPDTAAVSIKETGAAAGDEETPRADEAPDATGRPADNAPGWRQRVWLRIGVSALFLCACAWLFVLGRVLVDTTWAAELPMGQSVVRASKRFLTSSAPWFTKEGSWSVDSLWIANGYYQHERMLANLHSDLAFVALVQSFKTWVAVATLLTYFVLIWFCLAGLGVETSRWSGKHHDATVRLVNRRATLLLYFTAFYLLAELAVHLGSAFNAMPQTGVTLPWISSGGSASLGFGGLCAIAIGIAITSLRPVAMRPPANVVEGDA